MRALPPLARSSMCMLQPFVSELAVTHDTSVSGESSLLPAGRLLLEVPSLVHWHRRTQHSSPACRWPNPAAPCQPFACIAARLGGCDMHWVAACSETPVHGKNSRMEQEFGG